MKTFLSIDLDYWNSDNFMVGGVRHSKNFLGQLTKLDVPIYFCFDHRAMAGLVSESPARRLVNIDFHSDLDAEDRRYTYSETMGCGNWVNHISWRHGPQAEYTWIRPSPEPYEGYCHSVADEEGNNPFAHWDKRKFPQARMKFKIGRVPWTQVVGVAVAISPDYLVGSNTDWLIERLCPNIYEKWEGSPDHRLWKRRNEHGLYSLKDFHSAVYNHMLGNKLRDSLFPVDKGVFV